MSLGGVIVCNTVPTIYQFVVHLRLYFQVWPVQGTQLIAVYHRVWPFVWLWCSALRHDQVVGIAMLQHTVRKDKC